MANVAWLPSLVGAMLAAAACVWGARTFFAAETALFAGAILGSTLLLSTEAFIAKTDAMLCGAVTLAMAGLARIYAARFRANGRFERLMFWLAISLSALVKGPVGPMVAALAVIALAVWDRRTAWLRNIGWGWGVILFAAICGLVVAVLGCTTGLTWGAGYPAAHAIIGGAQVPFWFGLAKFDTTLATAVAGLPGGIFAPSLSTGAGFGNMLRWLFPGESPSAVVLLGMAAYFTGVVRAPLTAVFILTETTNSRGLMLPLMASALVADLVSRRVCETKLYEGLSETFLGRERPNEAPEPPEYRDRRAASRDPSA